MPNYDDLEKFLELRLATIADAELRERDPEEQLRRLQEASESIVAWHEKHRPEIPAHLNHFLKQSSLSKALDFIQNQ